MSKEAPDFCYPPPAEKLQNFFGVFLQFQIGVDSEANYYLKYNDGADKFVQAGKTIVKSNVTANLTVTCTDTDHYGKVEIETLETAPVATLLGDNLTLTYAITAGTDSYAGDRYFKEGATGITVTFTLADPNTSGDDIGAKGLQATYKAAGGMTSANFATVDDVIAANGGAGTKDDTVSVTTVNQLTAYKIGYTLSIEP